MSEYAEGPAIPCSFCGLKLAYGDAVRRTEQGVLGHGHRECDPSIVADYRVRMAKHTPQNLNR